MSKKIPSKKVGRKHNEPTSRKLLSTPSPRTTKYAFQLLMILTEDASFSHVALTFSIRSGDPNNWLCVNIMHFKADSVIRSHLSSTKPSSTSLVSWRKQDCQL
jgi:hypothetical protein